MITVPDKSEYKELLRFLDVTFRRPFKRLIPSLYADADSMPYHYVLRGENGKINGALCAYPGNVYMGGSAEPLKILDIGMVATRKSERGKGIMRTLVNHAVEEGKLKGAELVCLTGRRKRYEHLGFYPCGRNLVYGIDKMSTREVAIGTPITFVKVKTDEQKKFVDSLYAKSFQHTEFPTAKPSDVLGNWFAGVYVIHEGGAPIGYLYGMPHIRVLDGVVLDESDCSRDEAVMRYKRVIRAFVEFLGHGFRAKAIPTEACYNLALKDICENVSVHADFKFKVLDYRAVFLKLYAEAREFYGYNGEFAVSVEIIGKDKFEFGISDGKVFVRDYDGEVAVKLTDGEAIERLFGIGRIEQAPIPTVFALKHSDLN